MLCRHRNTIQKRGPANVLGWECTSCFAWWPRPDELRERSPLAMQMGRRERRLKAERHKRYKGPEEAKVLPFRREGA